MFRLFKRKDKRDKLEKEIDDILEEMTYQTKSGENYAKNIEHLERLYKAKSLEKSRKISPDTKAIVLANLAGIVLILTYEKLDHISSKAIGFVLKGRV